MAMTQRAMVCEEREIASVWKKLAIELAKGSDDCLLSLAARSAYACMRKGCRGYAPNSGAQA